MTPQLIRRRAPLLFLAVVLTFACSFTACGGAQKTDAGVKAAALPATAVCPVSKEKFKPTAATKTAVYKGKTYYLCCGGCTKKFAANPEKYVGGAAAKPAKPCDGGCDKPTAKKDCDDCKKPGAKKDCADCEKPGAKKDCDDCKKPAATPAATTTALPATATCPVSGKTFKPTAATQLASHNGKTYYMCCPGCSKKFAATPAKYAK